MDLRVVGANERRPGSVGGSFGARKAKLLRRGLAAVLVTVMALAFCSPGVLAIEYDNVTIAETIRYDIDPSEKILGPYDLDEGQIVKIDLTVTGGFGCNFGFVTHANYLLYQQYLEVDTIEELSANDALSLHVEWTVDADDDYYLIIQNIHGPSMLVDATIHGTFDAQYPSGISWALIAAIGAVIAVVIIVVVYFFVIKKKPTAAAPQQAEMPPPMYGPAPPPAAPPQQGAYVQAPPPTYGPPPGQAPPPQPVYAPPPAQAPPPARTMAPPPSGPRVCGSCGRTVTDATMRFCPFCGARMA